MNATVRTLTSRIRTHRLAIVTLPGESEVRVRFRRSNTTNQWRCDNCGTHRFSTCPHEIAACRHWQSGSNERTPSSTTTNSPTPTSRR